MKRSAIADLLQHVKFNNGTYWIEFCHYYKDKGKPLYKETQINIQNLCTWQDRELYVPAGSVQDTLQLSDILQIIQVLLFTMSVLLMLLSADNTEPLDLPGCLGAAEYWDNRAIQSCYERVLIVLFVNVLAFHDLQILHSHK